MRTRTWLVAALLFGSGFSALVYQVSWLRDFRLIFGASTAASAAVLAIFIGGLGAGGLLLGPKADRHPRPLLFYSELEAIVAASAAATPVLLAVVRYLYVASGGSTRLGGPIATLSRVVLSTLVLAVPTIAMGGTLPAAARAATRETDVGRRDVAALYAANTLGAVLGCTIATFWLLEIFGTRLTVWLAAAVNLLVALFALLADRSFGANDAPRSALGTPHLELRVVLRTPLPVLRTPHSAPLWLLLVSSGTVGFAFFLMELVWYRLLAPLLGGSVFTFGLILAVALLGIGVGGLSYALLADDRAPSLSAFGSTCLIEAAAVAATYALGDRIAILAATLLPLQATGFGARIAGWTIVAIITVLPPALAAGYQFPLLIALFGRAREDVGKQIGLAYAANTTGAVLGALAGGFGFLPWLSAIGTWQLVSAILLLLGAFAVLLAEVGRYGDRPRRFNIAASTAVVMLTIGLLAATGPTAVWRHSGIGAGRVTAEVFASPNRFREWVAAWRRAVVWEGDGTESGVALIQNPNGYAFIVNGKSDGSARGDAGTQVMSGLLGALAVPTARRAFVIGLGTGSTAGWLGAVPSIDRVDVVELEPLILEVARACAIVNRNVLGNPKVHITIGDAREALLTTRDRYDLIVSEPSNPYRAGIASLFTLEYYRAAADRLNDGGVFVQWVQAYGIDVPTLRTIYATLAVVFPEIDTWQTSPGDLLLVASKERRSYRAADLARRISEEPFKSALGGVWRAVDIRGLLAHYVAGDSLARRIVAAGQVDRNTDDRNVVEFRLARSVGLTLTTVDDVRNVARATEASRPPLEDENALRWPEVETAIISYNAASGSFLDPPAQGPPNERARQAALVRYYRDDDLRGAGDLWRQQSDDPRDPTEMAMLADIAANSGLDAAVPFIDRLRQYEPAEADVMLATLRLRQSRVEEAAASVEAALGRFRTDPWVMSRYIDRALQIAGIVASRDSSMARRMIDALSQPFAVRADEDLRLISVAELTRQNDFSGRCANAIEALEPYVPWTENFLRLRRDCYQATRSRRLQSAARDLDEFFANAAQPLLGR